MVFRNRLCATEAASFPIAAQEKLSKEVVGAMGFPKGRRVDVSVHPFTTSFGPADVRITSRFREDEWYQGLAGSVHECGHALYESQLRDSALPLDAALSMGTHESQVNTFTLSGSMILQKFQQPNHSNCTSDDFFLTSQLVSHSSGKGTWA